MKRRIFKLCLFLLLLSGGAILNIAVAWGCVLWPLMYREVEQNSFTWPIETPPGFGPPALKYGHAVTTLGTTQLGSWVSTPTGEIGRLDVHLAGWPRRGLYAERHYVNKWPGIAGTPHFSPPQTIWDGIAIPDWFSVDRFTDCLPTLPLWPGFAINTIFYATTVWLLFAAPFQFRRYWRIKRGLCLACAYPIGSSDVCTECGKPVTA